MAAVRNTSTPEEWKEWAIVAFKNTYGYEWQGDNLLLAREALLFTYVDFYADKFQTMPSIDDLKEVAEIISWNIWQMDGLKGVVPMTCHDEPFTPQKPKPVQLELFDTGAPKKPPKQLPLTKPCPGCARKPPLEGMFLHNGIYCKIMDWDDHKPFLFVDLIRENMEERKKETSKNG